MSPSGRRRRRAGSRRCRRPPRQRGRMRAPARPGRRQDAGPDHAGSGGRPHQGDPSRHRRHRAVPPGRRHGELHPAGRCHLHAGADRLAHAPDDAVQQEHLQRQVPPQSGRPRHPRHRLRQTHPARRLHHGAQPRRRRQCLARAAQRDQRRPGARPAHLQRRQVHRHHRRPRRPHQWLPLEPAGRPRSQGWHHQLARRRVEGRAPALQGRRRPDQDHALRRRAGRKLQLREPADDAGGNPGRGRRCARLRLHRGRARAWRRGDPSRGAGRRRFDRARHLHGCRGHETDEGARHLVRAHHHRRPVRDGEGARGLVSAAGRAQGRGSRPGDHGHRRQGVQGRREDRLRHRLRRVPARRQREGVRLHGASRHAADVRPAGGHHPRRRTAAQVRPARPHRGRPRRRRDRRTRQSAR